MLNKKSQSENAQPETHIFSLQRLLIPCHALLVTTGGETRMTARALKRPRGDKVHGRWWTAVKAATNVI